MVEGKVCKLMLYVYFFNDTYVDTRPIKYTNKFLFCGYFTRILVDQKIKYFEFYVLFGSAY